MDKSLNILCDALKKIISQLKPQNNALSFSLLTGKIDQGKSALLSQGGLEHITVDDEKHTRIYYNQQGIIVELGESWLNQSKNLLQYTLKRLNRCYSGLKISGIILCIDINELLIAEPIQFSEHRKAHAQMLTRFGLSLGYRVDTAILFTKLDALAGFCEFFQNEHASDLVKPLGFSLNDATKPNQLISVYKRQFDQLIEMLGQQVINKMHPARSSVKRTLIREFPLQLASLKPAIQSLIQAISPKLFSLKALYFTSAKQGGVSVDRLNKKIQHEYALTVQDKFPQSNNYRAYFIEGALSAFQKQTESHPTGLAKSHKWVAGVATGVLGVSLIGLSLQYLKTSSLLDEASKELLTYETLLGQNNTATSALYHLSKANTKLEKISSSALSLPTINQLKTKLRISTKHYLRANFLPAALNEIEQVMLDSKESPSARYQALKVYLMLGDNQRFSRKIVLDGFQHQWQQNTRADIQKKMALLHDVLRQPFQPISINQQIVSDVRNYLNALPVGYLYYTLAKINFPQDTQRIQINGFELASNNLPAYFTKAGFHKVVRLLPKITKQLQEENWVLARQDLNNLQDILLQAYSFEYNTWWQNFMRKSRPIHFQDYQQARQITENLYQSKSVNQLITLIQEQTSPELKEDSTEFNQAVASQFTNLNLMGHSAVRDLTYSLHELEKFLATLSMINDQGKTAFNLVKARFENDIQSDSLSNLYARARQLPEPISSWTQQLADDTWYILINESRAYINQKWQETVYPAYENAIAQRYPLDSSKSQEISLTDFDRFFSRKGILNRFVDSYLKPFLDTSSPEWQPKAVNGSVLPISSEMINELIRANVITNMFFPNQGYTSQIRFSLQKISLDPVISNLQLSMGSTKVIDNQTSDSFTRFNWPQNDAKLVLNSIEGNQYVLEEIGPWAFFKILQKVNVLPNENDNASLQILFEINGNSGRYLLKTENQINPFTPGILQGFNLSKTIV